MSNIENSIPNEWCCIQAKPTVFAYGHLAVDKVVDISATVERQEDGTWRWRLMKKWSMQGFEPSKELAMQRAAKELQRE